MYYARKQGGIVIRNALILQLEKLKESSIEIEQSKLIDKVRDYDNIF